jgi:hypothetical protein
MLTNDLAKQHKIYPTNKNVHGFMCTNPSNNYEHIKTNQNTKQTKHTTTSKQNKASQTCWPCQ